MYKRGGLLVYYMSNALLTLSTNSNPLTPLGQPEIIYSLTVTQTVLTTPKKQCRWSLNPDKSTGADLHLESIIRVMLFYLQYLFDEHSKMSKEGLDCHIVSCSFVLKEKPQIILKKKNKDSMKVRGRAIRTFHWSPL